MSFQDRVLSRTFMVTVGTILSVVVLHVLNKPLTDPTVLYVTGLAGVFVGGEKLLDAHRAKYASDADPDPDPSVSVKVIEQPSPNSG